VDNPWKHAKRNKIVTKGQIKFLYEVSRRVKFTELEGRNLATWGWMEGEAGSSY
jgi:hypothetical protein